MVDVFSMWRVLGLLEFLLETFSYPRKLHYHSPHEFSFFITTHSAQLEQGGNCCTNIRQHEDMAAIKNIRQIHRFLGSG